MKKINKYKKQYLEQNIYTVILSCGHTRKYYLSKNFLIFSENETYFIIRVIKINWKIIKKKIKKYVHSGK